MVAEGVEIGPAVSSDLIRLAVAYNDALDLCTRTQASNIDKVMEFFADDAMRVTVGQEPAVGKAAIRESFVRRSARLQQVVELKGIELWGDLVVCRIERNDSTHTASGLEQHLRILLVKDGKIKRLIVVVDPEEDNRLKPSAPD
jgi:ketosteroid isomerase-like protein